MYHICLPQCQIQLARREEIYPRRLFRPSGPSLRPERLRPLRAPSRRAVAGLNQRGDVAASDRRIDLERAGDDEPGLVGHRQRLQRVALEQARRPSSASVAGASALARKARENARLSRPRGGPPRRSGASRRRGRAICGGCRERPTRRRERKAQHRFRGVLAPVAMQVRSDPLSSAVAFVRNRSVPAPSGAARLVGGLRPSGSGASIQPARTRASRIMASACARVTSKPLRKPGFVVSPPSLARSSRRGRRSRSRRDPRAS